MGNLWILRLQFPKLLFADDGVHEEAACVAKDLGVGEFAAPDLDDRLSHLLRRGVGDGFLGQGRTDVAIVELGIKLCGEPVGDGGDEKAVAPLVLEAALSVAVATVAALEAAEASRRYLHGLHLFDEIAGLCAVGTDVLHGAGTTLARYQREILRTVVAIGDTPRHEGVPLLS